LGKKRVSPYFGPRSRQGKKVSIKEKKKSTCAAPHGLNLVSLGGGQKREKEMAKDKERRTPERWGNEAEINHLQFNGVGKTVHTAREKGPGGENARVEKGKRVKVFNRT